MAKYSAMIPQPTKSMNYDKRIIISYKEPNMDEFDPRSFMEVVKLKNKFEFKFEIEDKYVWHNSGEDSEFKFRVDVEYSNRLGTKITTKQLVAVKI